MARTKNRKPPKSLATEYAAAIADKKMPRGKYAGQSVAGLSTFTLQAILGAYRDPNRTKKRLGRLDDDVVAMLETELRSRCGEVPRQKVFEGRMPCGKWRGTPFGEIPDGSLNALIDAYNGLGPAWTHLLVELRAERERRDRFNRDYREIIGGPGDEEPPFECD